SFDRSALSRAAGSAVRVRGKLRSIGRHASRRKESGFRAVDAAPGRGVSPPLTHTRQVRNLELRDRPNGGDAAALERSRPRAHPQSCGDCRWRPRRNDFPYPYGAIDATNSGRAIDFVAGRFALRPISRSSAVQRSRAQFPRSAGLPRPTTPGPETPRAARPWAVRGAPEEYSGISCCLRLFQRCAATSPATRTCLARRWYPGSRDVDGTDLLVRLP